MVKENQRRGQKRLSVEKKEPNPAGREGNPVSLSPLEFEDALRSLLQVPPSKVKEAEKKKRTTKKSAK